MCVAHTHMTRTQIFLTDTERKLLKNSAKKLGISMAELIRRILDEHLKKEARSK